MASGADDAPGTAALALAAVVKGKRTKRQLAPPVAPVAAEPSSSSAAETSPSRSGADEAASGWATEEEEDMALCLMLLAQGRHGRRPEAPAGKEARFRSRRPANGSAGEGGEFVYECKTCNKSFPSFQALGGHRASHKKPRLLPPPPPPTTPPPAVASDAEEEKPQPTTQPIVSKPAAPINSNNSKQPRLHECSICGSEFPSGQALGGHMRRHRPLVPASVSAQENGSGRGSGGPRKEKSLLELDLNLPAPCDGAADVETSATSPRPEFAFAVATEMALILPPAASALVDCHY